MASIGCGGGDGGGSINSKGRNTVTGECSAQSQGETCTGEAAYEACIKSKCDAQYKACLGSGYASGSYSGPCGPMANCLLNCPCDATADSCEMNCFQQITPECMTCGQGIEMCERTSGCTEPVCTPITATATGTSTGTGTSSGSATKTSTSFNTGTGTSASTGNCAALQACCKQLVAAGGPQAAQYEQLCNSYANVPDATCLQVLTGYRQNGLCK
jgi:hypothetical protein